MKGYAKKVFIIAVLVVAVIAIVIGYKGYKEHRKTNYYFKEFTHDMKGKGYEVKLSDVNLYYLPAKSMRMSLTGKSDTIGIYLFDSNQAMNKIAANIDEQGCYDDGTKMILPNWTYPTYFFKKGCLIVQYAKTDTDSKVLNDLKDILGEPFRKP
jgi:hypothetical protein